VARRLYTLPHTHQVKEQIIFQKKEVLSKSPVRFESVIWKKELPMGIITKVGAALDPSGAVSRIDAEECFRRWERLRKLGGPP
jgi:hypothetical protein